MNKVYLFYPYQDADYGVFVAAKNWKEARNAAINSGNFDYDEFIDVCGHAIKEDGKFVYTDRQGDLGPRTLVEIGVTNFWWEGEKCDGCGGMSRVEPLDGKLLCSSCRDEIESAQLANES